MKMHYVEFHDYERSGFNSRVLVSPAAVIALAESGRNMGTSIYLAGSGAFTVKGTLEETLARLSGQK